ncbi:CNDH2_C domain-containing protein [Trichonephila clavipes]|nr:CNDH2_C domain-containing protein [Trichonephila clavipes]
MLDAIGDSNHDLDGIENIPIDDADVAPKPRRSMRQALKVRQIMESESPTEQGETVLQEEEKEEVVAIKRAIQKKNTCRIPAKLKQKNKNKNIFSASEFCTRTFFSMDQKFKKNCTLSLEVSAFQKNSALLKKFLKLADTLMNSNREKKRRRNNETDDDFDNGDVGVSFEDMAKDMENILESDTDNDMEAPHLGVGDIVIRKGSSAQMPVQNENRILHMLVDNENPIVDEGEPANIEPTAMEVDDNIPCDKPGDSFNDADDDDIDDDDSYFKQAAILQVNVYKEDLLQYVQTSDIMERYYEWEDIMMPFIEELELWLQQDGATCHTARATIDLLKDTFGDRLISRFGPVNWPPRSCDLTLLDYFLWGYLKSLVYADKPQTLDHLEDNIRHVIADIRPQMLEKVIENWTSRLDYIRASRGSPMPEIIFKM